MLGIFRPLGFIPFLSHPDENIRWEAADTLSIIADSSVIEPVFEALQRETDGHVSKRLVWALETAKAWDKLLLCLDLPNWIAQSQAASAIVRNGDHRFILPLLNRMIETDDLMHIYGGALSRLVNRSSVQPILQWLGKVSSAEMKGKLLTLLGRTKDKQVFDILISSLDEQEGLIRDGAVLGLMYLGDTRAIGSLQELLTHISSVDGDMKNVQFALHELKKLQSMN